MKLSTTLQLILLSVPFIGAISINGPNQAEHGTQNSNLGSLQKTNPAIFSDSSTDGISGAESFAEISEKGVEELLRAGPNIEDAGLLNETLNSKHARDLSEYEEVAVCGVGSSTKNLKTDIEALVEAGQDLVNASSNDKTMSGTKQARGLSEFGTDAVSAAESFASNFQAGIEALSRAAQNLANSGLNEEATSELRKWFGDGVKLLSSVVPNTTTPTKRDDTIIADESLATAAKQDPKHTFPPFYESKREDSCHYTSGSFDKHAEPLEMREDRERLSSFVMDDRIRKPRGIEDHNAHIDQNFKSCPCAPALH